MIDQPDREVWLVRGELEMHGRFQPLDVRAARNGDRFTGSATVVPANFGVAPMPVAGISGLVGHEVRVDFNIVLEPR